MQDRFCLRAVTFGRTERLIPLSGSDVDVFGECECAIDFDAELADGPFDLGVSQEKLDGKRVCGMADSLRIDVGIEAPAAPANKFDRLSISKRRATSKTLVPGLLASARDMAPFGLAEVLPMTRARPSNDGDAGRFRGRINCASKVVT